MFIIIIIAIILFILFLHLHIKKICESHLNLITGELKTGKSAFSLSLAKKRYNKILFIYKIKYYLYKIFKIKKPLEKPLFYSNIPVGFDYVPLTMDVILRKKRQRYKSVTWIDEASLFADSMSSISCKGMTKDELINFNKTLNTFIKLYCHSTHNGYLYYNTQALSDMHYAFKRCTNRYIYIHSSIKWLPFIVVYRVSELYHSEDNSSININNNGDVLENTKLCFMRKKIWKKYDRFAYSSFTDNKECDDNIIHGALLPDLKADYILSIIDLPDISTSPKKKNYIIKKKKSLFKKIIGFIPIKKRSVKDYDKKKIK